MASLETWTKTQSSQGDNQRVAIFNNLIVS